MNKKTKNITLKLNKPLRGFKAGATITVKPDAYWRARIADSKIDKCVEVIKKTATKPKKGN